MTSRWDEMMELEIPTEKGTLLYQEPGRRWVRILGGFAFAAAFLGLALMYALPVLVFWGDLEVDPVMGIMLLFLAAMFGLLSVMLVLSSIKGMPWCTRGA